MRLLTIPSRATITAELNSWRDKRRSADRRRQQIAFGTLEYVPAVMALWHADAMVAYWEAWQGGDAATACQHLNDAQYALRMAQRWIAEHQAVAA